MAEGSVAVQAAKESEAAYGAGASVAAVVAGYPEAVLAAAVELPEAAVPMRGLPLRAA